MIPRTCTIGPSTYEVLPLNASDSIRVMAKVLGIVSPALRSVAHLRDAATAVGAALAGGLDAIDVEDLLFLAKVFAGVTQVVGADGSKIPMAPCFDEHFRGRFFDMLGWLRAAAEVTYGPLAEIPAKMTPMTTSALSSG